MPEFVMPPARIPSSMFVAVDSIGTAHGFVEAFGAIKRMPHYKGDGYIAGEAPDGLVLSDGLPAARSVDLYHRATGIRVATTVSNGADGTYMFDGLDQGVLFDVLFRGDDDTENDIVSAWITPEPP